MSIYTAQRVAGRCGRAGRRARVHRPGPRRGAADRRARARRRAARVGRGLRRGRRGGGRGRRRAGRDQADRPAPRAPVRGRGRARRGLRRPVRGRHAAAVRPRAARRATCCISAVWPALVWLAFKVGALSYGGGYVIIPLMYGDAVEAQRWMTEQEFANAVAYGQITPGPVTHTVALVGYAASGLGGGARGHGDRLRAQLRDGHARRAVLRAPAGEPPRARLPRRRRPGRRGRDPRRLRPAAGRDRRHLAVGRPRRRGRSR